MLQFVWNPGVTSRASSDTRPRPIKRLSFEELFGLSAITAGIFCFLHLAIADDVALLTFLMGWTGPYFGFLCLGVGITALFGHRLRYWRMEGMVGAYLLWLALIAGSYVWQHSSVDWRVVVDGSHGGIFGRALGNLLLSALGRTRAGIVIHIAAWSGTFLLIRYSPLILGPLWITRHFLQWQAQRRESHASRTDVSAPAKSKTSPPALAGKAQTTRNRQGALRERHAATAGDPVRPAKATSGSPSANGQQRPPKSEARANRGAGGQSKASRNADTVSSLPKPQVRKKRVPPRKRSVDLPPMDLLSQQTVEKHEEQAQVQAQALEQIYAEFAQPVKVVNIETGPAVTRFGVKPLKKERNGKMRPVRVRDILALRDDVAMGLEVTSLRYLAPVPGRPYVGIEVPNSDRHTVDLRGVLDSWEFQTHSGALKIALGRDTSGEAVIADLGRAPHLLVGGATGTGKSTCINALLASLLMQHGPDTLNLILVDPKQIELTPFEGLPHLVGRVATELDVVPTLLLWLLLEMEARYSKFKEAGVRNILGYNQHARLRNQESPLPYIVLVIDELADLMMMGNSDIEPSICRLAQKCRATGIHIVLATQRPSVDVVTGVIKANFPSRIAFAVSSNTDSRVVLDAPGAETLLGKGDMLFKDPERGKHVRIQGSWISDEDIQGIVAYWKKQHRETPAAEQIEPWRGLLASPDTVLSV